ncbi:major tail protein [Enterococcus massiliensis]|uniref:major tail protein n=1 Tax=Enterococcus massiliensis TaxID=1640685 RepID=UPI00065E0318|nr:major tail protein [Enterococcus massiliensis]
MAEKKSKTGIISVEKPTWFPLMDESTDFPTYDKAVVMGTAVSVKPSANYETAQDFGDSVVQDQFTAFGGAEVELEANGYTHKVLTTITGGKILKGGALRSGEDIAQDGAFAYRRKKSNGKYRYTIFYKGQFILDSDETSTLEGNKVTFTHPTWKGTFVDVPGVGYMYSVDEDDEGVDTTMIENWFTTPANPLAETEPETGGNE